MLLGGWEVARNSGNLGSPLFSLEQYAVICTTRLLSQPLHETFIFLCGKVSIEGLGMASD